MEDIINCFQSNSRVCPNVEVKSRLEKSGKLIGNTSVTRVLFSRQRVDGSLPNFAVNLIKNTPVAEPYF